MQQGGIEMVYISGNQMITTLDLPVKWLSWLLSQNYLRLLTNHGHLEILVYHPHLYLDGEQSPRMHQFLFLTSACIQHRKHKFLSFTESIFTQQVIRFSIRKSLGPNHCKQKTKAFSLVVIPCQGDGLTNRITIIRHPQICIVL